MHAHNNYCFKFVSIPGSTSAQAYIHGLYMDEAASHLPTLMFRLECDSLLLVTLTTPGPGIRVALQIYVSERVASSEGISNVILYTPAESITGIIVVLLPPGPPRFPVTTTSLSTTAGSSWMVQVRVRGSPWWRVTVALGSRLIASVGGGTVEICVI